MKKITNLVIKPTKFSEDKKWVDVLSLKIRLLQISDWILLPDSSVFNVQEWVSWRKLVKAVKRDSFPTFEQAKVYLNHLSDNSPKIIKFDELDVPVLENIIKSKLKMFCEKNIEYQMVCYGIPASIVSARYQEAIKYTTKSKLVDFPMINAEQLRSGKSIKSVVDSFKQDNKNMKTIMITQYNIIEDIIKRLDSVQSKDELCKIHEMVKEWILTLTLNQTAI